MPSEARAAAIAKLNDAITEYAQEIREDEGWYVTGWQVAVAAVHPERTTSDEVGLLYEQAPGQPWHTTLGLITAASDYYRNVGAPSA